MNRGQTSAEFLIILSVALIIIIFVFSYSQDSLNAQRSDAVFKSTQMYLDGLTKTANSVYFEGAGAKKKAYYVVPKGIDAEKSGLSSNTFRVNVQGTDIWSKADVNLIGSFDVSEGGHWVYLTSYPGYVAIGTQKIILSKYILYNTASADTNISDVIFVTNNGSESAEITLTNDWSESDVNFDVGSTLFVVGPGETVLIDFTFGVGAGANGSYSGNVFLNADFASADDEYITIPATVDVLEPSCTADPIITLELPDGQTSYFYILPAHLSFDLNVGQRAYKTISLCNDSNAAYSAITFSSSDADINAFTYPISDYSNLSAYSCQSKILSFRSSLDYTDGIYDGSIIGTASVEDYDSVYVSINMTNLLGWKAIASDDFECGGTNCGSGWSESWTLTGDAGIDSSGTPHSGTRQLRLRDDGGVAKRSVNMSGANYPRISFAARVSSFESEDKAYFKVSTNGTSWTTLKTWTAADSDDIFHDFTFDLDPYYADAQDFRIGYFSDMSSNNDYLYIDDVNIYQWS